MSQRRKFKVTSIQDIKEGLRPLSMLTCYDYSFAQLLNQSDVDLILVGDSAAMVMHGESSTVNISTEVMAVHVRAVSKGAPDKFIIGDLPFLSYRKSLDENMKAVELLMKAGANAVKLEGADAHNIELVKHLVQSGVPVMGHLGLTPQSVNQLGGHKVQAVEETAQKLLREQAQELEEAGCFSVVLECVPANVSEQVTKALKIPTIGIGAGPHVDGQVLVLQDMLGFNSRFKPNFLKTYLEGESLILDAINQFHTEVTENEFPQEEHTYYVGYNEQKEKNVVLTKSSKTMQ